MGREISSLATNNINEQANHLIIKQRDQISCARAELGTRTSPPLLINTCPNELTMDRCGTPATAPDADLTDSADWKKAFTVSKSVKVCVIIVLTRFLVESNQRLLLCIYTCK